MTNYQTYDYNPTPLNFPFCSSLNLTVGCLQVTGLRMHWPLLACDTLANLYWWDGWRGLVQTAIRTGAWPLRPDLCGVRASAMFVRPI